MDDAEQFWNEKYVLGNTGWDMGQVSPPLAEYINGLENKHISVLIPGCGNAYEAQYLWQQGFKDITVVDISAFLVSRLRHKFKDTGINIIHRDLFAHEGWYDLILEQTFFCAILPGQREAYVQHAHHLLNDGGKVAGLLFNDFGFEDHPPYRGSEMEYRSLFADFFDILIMEPCRNSIEPRMGNELFFEMVKKRRRQIT